MHRLHDFLVTMKKQAVGITCMIAMLGWIYEFICLPTGKFKPEIFRKNLQNFKSFNFLEVDRQAMENALEILIDACIHIYELLIIVRNN